MNDSTLRRIGLGPRLLVVVLLLSTLMLAVLVLVTRRALQTEAQENLVAKARAITIEAENARQYVAALRGKHHAFDEKKLIDEMRAAVAGATTKAEILERARGTAYYASIPIVAAWTVAQTNAEKAGYRFKTPRIQPRNPRNEPDEVERQMLESLAVSRADETWRIDEGTNSLRYMKPVVLGPECLVCHGSVEHYPEGKGLDPLGFPMEGWKSGEVRGGFEVIADLAPLQARTATATWQMVGVAVVSLVVLALLFSVLLARVLSKPLAEASATLRKLAEGDLSQQLETTAPGEVGTMAVALNAAVGGMREAMVGVNRAAHDVSTASKELADAATHLSESTAQQAVTLQQTSATMKEVATSQRESASGSRQTAQLAADAKSRADEGREVVNTAMRSIEAASVASRQISEISETIDGIAHQTNLLALNAAVEAARAGEHGRGFAVVASEVRVLALQTKDAARRIHSLVGDTLQKVNDGAAGAQQSKEALGDIVERVRSVSDVIDVMVRQQERQAQGLDRVNSAVTTVDTHVQGTAAQTQQLSATARALETNATTLQRLVGRFRLES
jgi:methyl-accepting chemotaxis protein